MIEADQMLDNSNPYLSAAVMDLRDFNETSPIEGTTLGTCIPGMVRKHFLNLTLECI